MVQKDMISVIVPVYQVERYLEKCVRSVMENTYRYLEIICIDDGGADASSAILDRLVKEDDRIIVIHQENRGVAEARNIGLEIASGKYVSFVDSDDFIHPAMFKTMIECIQSMNASIVTCRAEKVLEEKETKHTDINNAEFQQLNAENFFRSYYARHMVWGKLYRKQHLKGHRFSADVRYGEDTLFNLGVVAHIHRPIVYETTAPFYYYMIRQSSISHSYTYKHFMDFGDWYYKHRFECKSSGSVWKWMLPMQAIKMTLSFRYEVMFAKGEKRIIKRADRVLRSCYHDIVSDPAVSVKQKAIHAVMIIFPSIYRAFRRRNDPMLEKNNPENIGDQAVHEH